jgi:hypothetical protein
MPDEFLHRTGLPAQSPESRSEYVQDQPPEPARELPKEYPPIQIQAGPGLAIAALVVPLIGGTALMFVKSVELAIAVSLGTVGLSALLLAIDAGQLGTVDAKGQQRENPVTLFILMCLLWIVVYPMAYYRRTHFTGPNLFLPGILVALFFAGVPFLVPVLFPPEVPACDSPEVVKLVDQLIRGNSGGIPIQSIYGHRQVRFDEKANNRFGECTVRTNTGVIVVRYIVRWRDRDKGMFEVQITP